MLTEPGTLDELGIGQIRDAFSDVLFPGISTIQTRAKYFIIVPRILRDFQVLQPAQKKNLQDYLLKQENAVAEILHEAHDEKEWGIIGRTRLSSGGVDRRPSVTYWTGLRTFGLVRTPLSLRDFCRQLESGADNEVLIDSALAEGSDDLDCLNGRPLVNLPDYSEKWKEKGTLSLRLTRKEAEFLKGRLTETPAIASSVPAQMFRNSLVEAALLDNETTETTAFDFLVDVMKTGADVDQTCLSYLRVAQEFSLAMEGPHLRYNIILNKSFPDEVGKYEEEYGHWLEKVRRLNLFCADSGTRWLELANFDKKRHIKGRSQQFVKACCAHFQSDNPVSHLDDIVFKQAVANKGNRSWLKRGLAEGQWLGIRRLDYRWGSAINIIRDIQVGLHADA